MNSSKSPAIMNRRNNIQGICIRGSLVVHLGFVAAIGVLFPALGFAEPTLPLDQVGCVSVATIDEATANGGDLSVTIRFPSNTLPGEGVWVEQRDPQGDVVGEAWAEAHPLPGFLDENVADPETRTVISGGLATALTRGPRYTLSLLDAHRAPIGPPRPLHIRLDCTDPAHCVLLPTLDIETGGAHLVSPPWLAALDASTATHQPLRPAAIRAEAPTLEAAMTDFFWQSSFEPNPPSGCRCTWVVAYEVKSLSGGAHLLEWQSDVEISDAFKTTFGGATTLAAHLYCFETNKPVAGTVIVEIDELTEIEVPFGKLLPCTPPCSPAVTHSVVYQAMAVSTSQGPASRITSAVSWGWDTDPQTVHPLGTVHADLDHPHHPVLFDHQAVRYSRTTRSRFDGHTALHVGTFGVSDVRLRSTLDMFVHAAACQNVPALEVGLLVAPRFGTGERCSTEIHKSLRIGT